MKVSYRGIEKNLPPRFQEKLEAKFSKLSKLLERRGEKEAHVMLTTERHLHKSEVTIQFYDHQLVGLGSDADVFTSLSQALDKLEKKALKTRTKFREKKRRDNVEPAAEESFAEPAAPARANRKQPRVFHVNHHDERKPMTLEEALIELEGDGSLGYLVYRDADKERISVLVRRKDGNFDLIES